MPIDLHSHTYYSDGRYSPSDVIEMAVQRGIRTLAITDHDNTNGAREALRYLQGRAQPAGIELIPAIELTTRWPGANLRPEDANVDLLGYFIDLTSAEFRAFEEATLDDIHSRIESCCRQLTRRGYALSLEDVFGQNPRYAGAVPAIQAIIEKGHAREWRDAARLFDSVWLKRRETPFTINSAIEQIHLAGGVAVLAHPTIVRPNGQAMTREYLARLVDAGLDGIEIYHHRLDAAARSYFLSLANEFHLLVTGGSDLHGWIDQFATFGQQPVTEEMLEALRERHLRYRRK